MFQTIFNTLGDFNLAFAREQLHRAHFAHIHAHGISSTAKFGIHRGQRGFSFGRGFLVRHRRRGIGHQQRLGVRRLVIHLNAHVVDHADDDLELFGVEHLVGQMVVDLGVGEVAALLAQHNQIAQPVAARLGVGGRHLAAFELLDQRFFFGGERARGLLLATHFLTGFACNNGRNNNRTVGSTSGLGLDLCGNLFQLGKAYVLFR